MSPTDAKRGAKRRKNKRGGGAGKAGAPPTPSSGTAHGDPSTIPSLNGEVRRLGRAGWLMVHVGVVYSRFHDIGGLREAHVADLTFTWSLS